MAAPSEKLTRKPAGPSIGPCARLKALRATRVPRGQILRYCTAGMRRKAIRAIQLSLPAFASAARCFFSFCELISVPAFPVSERAVLLWSAIFNEGRTYGNYLNFARKACFYLNSPTDWFTAAVVNASRGLRAAGKEKFRFPNFTRSEIALNVISFEPHSSQFDQLAFCAFLFALRVPSEALILRRAHIDDPLDMSPPQFEKGLIAARFEGNSPQLILKLAYRKNLPTGCVLYRPCFCSISEAPQLHRFARCAFGGLGLAPEFHLEAYVLVSFPRGTSTG